MRHGIILAAGVLALIGPAGARGADGPEALDLVRAADRLARQKKYDEALDAVRKAVRLAPDNDQYRFVASEVARRAGRYDEGLEHALAAIKLNDKVPVYYVQAAATAYAAQDGELTLKMCRKVIDMGAAAVGEEAFKGAKVYEALVQPRTYTLTWNLDPTRGTLADGTLMVALPKDGLPYQSVRVRVEGARAHQVRKGEPNDVLVVVPDGTNTFRVITTVTVRPVSFRAKMAKAAPGPLPREAVAALGPAELFDPSSPRLRKVAGKLRDRDPAKTVRNVLTWMQQNIDYKVEGEDITKRDFASVEELLDRGKAECRGYAMLFTALCRSAGVPARPVWGVFFRPEEKGGGFSSHNWVEVYVPACGWVPVDPQQPETFGWLPATHVRVHMDLRKTSRTPENLPLHNLLYMNGEKLQFDVAPAGTSPGEGKGR
jgi:tetratricopeptide (TPR) repeat protein